MRSLTARAALRFSVRSRRRKAEIIGQFMRERGIKSVVLAGSVGPQPGRQNSAIVENEVARNAEVVHAFDVRNARCPWPFFVADARSMPCRTGAVGLVLSNAVIEHVGDADDQAAMAAEHMRVGEHWIITTPNRWFPVESHTSTVFRHWFPQWRNRREEFTRLLSLHEFRELLPAGTRIIGRPWSATFIALSD